MKKLKIAFLNKYQNKVNRGAETFAKELASRLSKNHEVDILTNLNFKKYDIVIPINGRFQVLIVRMVTWLNGSKMVISGQSGLGFDDRINLYSFPNCFVPVSSHALEWAKKINPFVKSVYIPNGADLGKFREQKKSNGKVILCVGAFTNEKRHDLTIKAVAELQDIKLIIVGGGGNERSKIEDLGIRMLGKGRFEVLSVPNEKMSDVYKMADVFVYPTVPWESFGIAMVEAMASGLSIVANNDPIRREIVGDAGVFVDPTNTEAYAKAIEKALKTDWGNKPRKQAEKFDWDKIALEYERLFQTLVVVR